MPALSAVEGSAVALGEARIWEKPGLPVCRSTAQKSGHYPNLDDMGVCEE
jgi:hypothetical protein